MAAIKFEKARRSQSKLRLAIGGGPGSGKSFTSLLIAKGLAERLGAGPIAACDTEHKSLAKYANVADFDCVNLESFHPQNYIDVIRAAADGGYGTLVIDSLSHSWMGRDGALELANQAAKRSNSSNTFAAWRDITPLFNKMMEAIIAAPMHMICTYRTKVAYVIEQNERGKSVPRKVGTEFITKGESEYEFDVVGEMTQDNSLIVTKTRCAALNGRVFDKPNEKFVNILCDWLSDGAPVQQKPQQSDSSAPEQPAGNGTDVLITLWTTKINAATSQSDLESLTGDIRSLSDDVRRALMPVYKEKKAALAG